MPATNKAQIGQLNFAHPTVQGLIADWAVVSGGGNIRSQGLLPLDDLVLTGGGTWGMGPEGRCLVSNVNDSGAWATAPAILQPQVGTLAWRGVFTGTSSQNAQFAGITYTNSDSPPYASMLMFVNSGNISALSNRSGSYFPVSSTIPPAIGKVMTCVVTFNSAGSWSPTLYVGGSVFTTTPGTGTINYSTTSQIFLGSAGYALTRNCNCISYGMRMWNRILSPGEITLLSTGWYDLRQPRPRSVQVFIPVIATYLRPRPVFVGPTWLSKAALQYP